MKLIISFIVVCAAVYANANQETASGDGTLGNDPKALQAKFDLIDRKLLELQVELKNQREEVARNFSLLQDCVTPTAPSTQITSTTPNPKGPRSCKEVASNVSGVHLIYVDNNDAPFQVYCEMEKNGGGWLVVQHRFNGSVDFYRTWDEYREGFGDLNGEFWLGLEKMHQITASRNHELIVELKDFNNKNKQARYYGFQIGSESEGYKLKTLGDYRGDAGDTMKWYNKGMKFSTKDRDNDGASAKSCAQEREGAWWYGDCTYANLNGKYRNDVAMNSMFWFFFHIDYNGLSYSRMMIREL